MGNPARWTIGTILLAVGGLCGAQLPGVDVDDATSIGAVGADVEQEAARGGLGATLQRELGSSTVRSEVVNGVAMLSGTVSSEAERTRAAEIARGFRGVTRVRNDITVRAEQPAVASSADLPDAPLDDMVRSKLRASSTLAERDIRVELESDQTVRLTGHVVSEAEKLAAGRIAADVRTVALVRNDLRVGAASDDEPAGPPSGDGDAGQQ